MPQDMCQNHIKIHVPQDVPKYASNMCQTIQDMPQNERVLDVYLYPSK
jgi:hypothetical protein